MPIAAPEDENHPEQPVTPNLKISHEPYVSQVIDTRKEGLDGIASFAAGSRWACDYYKQVLGRDSAPGSFQQDLPFVYGQYKEIRGLELIVEDPLSHRQKPDGNRAWESTGAARCYSIITPNVGDVFIADIGAGMNAILTITTVGVASIFPEAMTRIEYRVQQPLDSKSQAAIRSRVVETEYFSRENMRHGLKALLTNEDISIENRLTAARDRLLNLYLTDFYSDRFKTLEVPDQVLPTYDPHLVDYVKATFDAALNPRVRGITAFNMGSDVFNKQQTLFDALLMKDPALLFSCSRKAGISCIENYKTRPLLRSVYYSGVRSIVCLIDVHYNVNNEHRVPVVTDDWAPSQPRQLDVRSLLPQTNLATQDHEHEPEWIKPVLCDEYYVFSKNFYEESEGTSVLEQMVLDVMYRKPIDLGQLADLADRAHKFNNLERFYYTPFILTLIKLAPGIM